MLEAACRRAEVSVIGTAIWRQMGSAIINTQEAELGVVHPERLGGTWLYLQTDDNVVIAFGGLATDWLMRQISN